MKMLLPDVLLTMLPSGFLFGPKKDVSVSPSPSESMFCEAIVTSTTFAVKVYSVPPGR